MKDSQKHSKKVLKLYRSLKRKRQKVQKVVYDEPVDALVYAAVSENLSSAAAQSVMKKFAEHFVDLNDLRVSRVEEIIDVIGADTPVTKNIAMSLTKVLKAVFDKYNTVSLEALKKVGKRPAKQTLEKMDGTTHFAVNYCMLTSLQAHAMPLTEVMIDYLRGEELVHPDADQQQIEGFLARLISVDKTYEFYTLLRLESESRKGKKKRKRKTAAKPVTEKTSNTAKKKTAGKKKAKKLE